MRVKMISKQKLIIALFWYQYIIFQNKFPRQLLKKSCGFSNDRVVFHASTSGCVRLSVHGVASRPKHSKRRDVRTALECHFHLRGNKWRHVRRWKVVYLTYVFNICFGYSAHRKV